VRLKSLCYIHREFSYESPGEKKFENRSIFAKVIIKHQVAYFFLGHGVDFRMQLHYILVVVVVSDVSDVKVTSSTVAVIFGVN